jgi:hypothetical protein
VSGSGTRCLITQGNEFVFIWLYGIHRIYVIVDERLHGITEGTTFCHEVIQVKISIGGVRIEQRPHEIQVMPGSESEQSDNRLSVR